MSTTRQIIYDIKEVLRKYNDDSEYSDRHILYVCNLKRAKFLRQLLEDKTRGFDSILLQDLCLSFEEVSKGLCGIEAECTVLKSTQPIPQLLEVKNRSTMLSIQPSVAFSRQFKIIDWAQASYILDRPYTNSIYATVDVNNYVYLISRNEEHKLMTCLYITAIYENPSDLEDYVNCCNCEIPVSCFDEDTTYPAPSFIIDLVRDEVVKLFLGTKEKIQEDKDNNSDDQ